MINSLSKLAVGGSHEKRTGESFGREARKGSHSTSVEQELQYMYCKTIREQIGSRSDPGWIQVGSRLHITIMAHLAEAKSLFNACRRSGSRSDPDRIQVGANSVFGVWPQPNVTFSSRGPAGSRSDPDRIQIGSWLFCKCNICPAPRLQYIYVL